MRRYVLVRCSVAVLMVVALGACDDGKKAEQGADDAGLGGGSNEPPVACTKDADCSDGNACTGVEVCKDGYCVAGKAVSCDDHVACTRDLCDPVDGSCTHRAPDADSDGVADAKCVDQEGSPLGTDCDDEDPERFPGNTEVCQLNDASSTRDEDCNPKTFGSLDGDADGFINAACHNDDEATGKTYGGEDCDDAARTVHPTAPEVCDRFDNNCNGKVDEGLLVSGYFDEDGDGYGNPAPARSAWPTDPAKRPAPFAAYDSADAFEDKFDVEIAADGKLLGCPGNPVLAPKNTDCGDDPSSPDALYRHENAPELCDGVDNDCDGDIDDNVVKVGWYRDRDGDGFGDASGGDDAFVESCARQPGYSLFGGDCRDNDPDINPRAQERCNGIDDNCANGADFVIAPGNFENDDNDRFADALCGTLQPDCDDENASVYPGAPEICDQLDNDCNGVSDTQTSKVSWYVDLDGDGFGDPKVAPVLSCETIADRVMRAGDCDDASSKRNPNAKDDCSGQSGIDDNCDGSIDEGEASSAFFRDLDKDGYGAGVPLFACVAPVGYVAATGDCDDGKKSLSPGVDEVCDPDQGLDDDCDGAPDCLDTDCVNAADCQALVRLKLKDPAEPITAVLAQPFDVTIEALTSQNTPVAGLDLTLSCDTATRGVWASPVQNNPTHALTDANGHATFSFTPGQAIDKYRCTVSAGEAIPKIIDVQTIAPADGTLFSAVNASHTAGYLVAGSAIGSPIYSPTDLVIGADGTAYVSSYYSYRVARIDKRGALDFVAGSGQSGNDGDGGLASDAKLGYVERLALDDARKRLYLADQSGARVRMVNLANGKIYAYAGGGAETSYNGGSALAAKLDVGGMDVGSDGALYVLDVGAGLLRIGLDGTITRLYTPPASCTQTAFMGCWGSQSYCDLTKSPDGSLMMVGYTCRDTTYYFGLGRFDLVTKTLSVMPGGNATTGDGQSLGLTNLGYSPAIARDAEGNVYLAQQHRIRRIDQNTRLVSTLLGSTTAGGGGDYGPYASAQLNDPRGLAFDPEGGLWIAEQGGHTVRRIFRAPKAKVTSVALELTQGDAQTAYPFELMDPLFVKATRDGAAAESVELSVEPSDPSLVISSFVTNFEGIGIVTPRSGYDVGKHTGDVTVFDLDGHVSASDSFGWETLEPPAGTITTIVNPARVGGYPVDGQSGGASMLYYPTSAATATDGTVYFAEYYGKIYSLDPDGFVHWLAGGGNDDGATFGPVAARTQNLGNPQALAYYEAGKQLFVATTTRVYRVDLASATVSVLMGLGTETAPGKAALDTKLNSTYSIAVSASGILYVADTLALRSVDTKLASPSTVLVHDFVSSCSGQPAGALYGSTSSQALGLAADGTLYLASTVCPSTQSVLVRIDGTNQHTQLTSTNGSTFAGPLAASAASINYVRGNMAVDGAGNLYFGENGVYRVRRLTKALQIEPVAGTGTSGSAGDFGPATSAQLNIYYSGVAVTSGGDVIAADYNNYAVRRIWKP